MGKHLQTVSKGPRIHQWPCGSLLLLPSRLEGSLVVHSDDSTALGVHSARDKLEAGLTNAFEIKVRGRIGGHLPSKEMRILNKVITLTDKGLIYEADPRHAELLARSQMVTNSVCTPGIKDSYLTNQATQDLDSNKGGIAAGEITTGAQGDLEPQGQRGENACGESVCVCVCVCVLVRVHV